MLWALLCAGCTLAPKFQTPQLSVVDVQMLGGDLVIEPTGAGV